MTWSFSQSWWKMWTHDTLTHFQGFWLLASPCNPAALTRHHLLNAVVLISFFSLLKPATSLISCPCSCLYTKSFWLFFFFICILSGYFYLHPLLLFVSHFYTLPSPPVLTHILQPLGGFPCYNDVLDVSFFGFHSYIVLGAGRDSNKLCSCGGAHREQELHREVNG